MGQGHWAFQRPDVPMMAAELDRRHLLVEQLLPQVVSIQAERIVEIGAGHGKVVVPVLIYARRRRTKTDWTSPI